LYLPYLYFDESLGAGDFGLRNVVDEHVFDGAFAIFDVYSVAIKSVLVLVRELAFWCISYLPIARMVAILS
jgi:hypothetical protein